MTGTRRRAQAQPRRLGAEQVASVFFTHLHFDCTSGLSALPRPLRCLKGRAEMPLDHWPFLYVRDFDGVAFAEEFTFEKVPDMPPLGPCIDVLGDGSIWAVATPGHTIGHVSYVVMGEQGPVLGTGDAVPTRRALEQGLDPLGYRYRELALNSLKRLRNFVTTYPQVMPIFGREYGPPARSSTSADRGSLAKEGLRSQGRFE